MQDEEKVMEVLQVDEKEIEEELEQIKRNAEACKCKRLTSPAHFSL